MAWQKQQHGQHQQLRHVGQNRKQEDGATTLEEGNDRWILCQLEFFYARALSQERDFLV